jgi:hypothetical protein
MGKEARTISGRYIVQKAPGVGGEPIPEDEPCVVIRGQDILAPVMLKIYQDLYLSLAPYGAVDGRVIDDVDNHGDRLRDWQMEHPGKIKWADR